MPTSSKNVHITFECVATGQLIPLIINCSRCGENHTNLTFEPFRRPPGGFTHFAPCPTTHEPILMKVIPDKKGRRK